MKTPEEIKRELKCRVHCSSNIGCYGCPADLNQCDAFKDDNGFYTAVQRYIQQLEEKLARRDELLAVLGVKVPEEVSHEND